MDHAIANVMQTAGLSLRDAITLATRNPARVGRIAYRQRGLNPGDRADLVRFRYDEATSANQDSRNLPQRPRKSSRHKPSRARASRPQLLQLRVLRFGLLQDRDVRVGILP